MTCAERNRAAAAPQRSIIGLGLSSNAGPLKLQVANLHPNITVVFFKFFYIEMKSFYYQDEKYKVFPTLSFIYIYLI
jgi:hypothetical protein